MCAGSSSQNRTSHTPTEDRLEYLDALNLYMFRTLAVVTLRLHGSFLSALRLAPRALRLLELFRFSFSYLLFLRFSTKSSGSAYLATNEIYSF